MSSLTLVSHHLFLTSYFLEAKKMIWHFIVVETRDPNMWDSPEDDNSSSAGFMSHIWRNNVHVPSYF